MLFSRRAQHTRQHLAALFEVEINAPHDLPFLPLEYATLYTNACKQLSKPTISGPVLMQVAASVAPFMAYRFRSNGDSYTEGDGLDPAHTDSEGIAEREEGKPTTHLNESAIDEHDREYAHCRLLYEAKLYLLCLLAIAQNQFVCDSILRLAPSIQYNLREWSLRENRALWYLYEKTPWYWANYMFLKRHQMPHPIAELRENINHLKALEKNTFAFIGVGSRILSRYEAIGRSNFIERLSNLIRKDQLLFEKFFAIPERDQQHRSKDTVGVDARDRLRFHVFRTLSRSREHEIAAYENEEDEKEDVLYNIAQAVNLSYFDYRSSEVVGETVEATSNVRNLYDQLVKNIERAVAFPATMRHTLDLYAYKLACYKRPSVLSTNWLKYSGIALGFTVGLLSVVKRREDIIDWLVDFRVLATNFVQKNIFEPLKDMYKTIRYEERAFNIMDARTLEADVLSLTRMVEEFVRKYDHSLSESQINDIAVATANSDISAIMPVYESELEAPIKNALFGDLLSLLLIQVQKAKVDVAKAMLALDKLMRANELNFQLFAVTPALLLVGGLTRYVYRRVTRIDVRKNAHSHLRETLRNVERLLDLNFVASSSVFSSPSSGRSQQQGILNLALSTSSADWRTASYSPATRPDTDLQLEETGRLMAAINELILTAMQLPLSDRRWLLEDLQDLASEELSVGQKLATINRMYHTHPFLTSVV